MEIEGFSLSQPDGLPLAGFDKLAFDYPYPDYGAAHARRQITFGSFNNISKLTPRTIALWAKVLAAVPDSRLLLKAPSFMDGAAVRRFADLFAEAGVAAERLEFRGPAGLTEMMAEYAEVDIALDTFPFNGGTTTCQALWMGAPVVSLAGENFCQRVGASILATIGRPEWIAGNEEEFVAIAVCLAADREAQDFFLFPRRKTPKRSGTGEGHQGRVLSNGAGMVRPKTTDL